MVIAFSGGADSTALLHAAVHAVGASRLRAVHVDHGLHPASGEWSAHCERSAASLGVDYRGLKVEISSDDIARMGVEAAAREARYQALLAEIGSDELLLTAQHQEDQLETVLLQLMRGSGLPGLSAMAPIAAIGHTVLVRPLLDRRRLELCAFLRSHGIDWLEDPANRDLRFDRSFLRAAILPRLRERWPAADASGARSASHLAEGARLLRQLAATDLADCEGGEGRIDLTRFVRLSAERKRNALRHWLSTAGFRTPGSRRLQSILTDVIGAGAGTSPVVITEDAEVRRYRDRLYLLRRRSDDGPLPERLAITPTEAVELPADLGRIRLQAGSPSGLSPELLSGRWEIRFRAGGERIAPASDRPTRRLKQLLQESGVVPWMRDRIPLLYCDNRLVAVADLWIAADCRRQNGVAVVWEDHPPLY